MFTDKLVATAVGALVIAAVAAFAAPLTPAPTVATMPTPVATSRTTAALTITLPPVTATSTLTPTPPNVGSGVLALAATPCACLKHAPPPELVSAVIHAFPPARQWEALEVADCESGGATPPYSPTVRGTMDESDGEVPIGTWQMKPKYFGALPTDYEGQARIVAREVAISGWRYWGCKPSGGAR